MKIKTLIENTCSSNKFKGEHGISFYIETKKHKLLFDLGQSGLFIENARKLNVNLEEVDTVIISHGHNDHGGALKQFLEVNNTAKIYIRENAFEPHLSIHEGVSKYIGLDTSLKNHPQIILLKENLQIDDELYIFSDVKTKDFIAKSNNNLYMQHGEVVEHDDFTHEQNLIIKEDDLSVLIAGCAHRGIVNIVRRANEILNKDVNYCIGGFHLSSPRTGKREDDETIDSVTKELLKSNTKYMTCHCTGLAVYELMKERMKERLDYISTGMVVELK